MRPLLLAILVSAAAAGCSRSQPPQPQAAAPAPAPVPPPAAPVKKSVMVCRNSVDGRDVKCGTPNAVMVGIKSE